MAQLNPQNRSFPQLGSEKGSTMLRVFPLLFLGIGLTSAQAIELLPGNQLSHGTGVGANPLER